MKKRSLAVLLLVALLVVGCADSNSDRPKVESAGTSSETESVECTHGIPDGLKYDNAPFRLLSASGLWMGDRWENYDLEKMDIVQKANYDRLVAVEEKLGIKFDIILPTGVDPSDMIRRSVGAGDSEYEYITCNANWLRNTVYEGLYLSAEDLPYVDLDKPWWGKEYIESVSINPADPTILFGSINHLSVQRSVATIFNTELLDRIHHLTPDDMYEMVLDGEWTLDKFVELCKGAYNDTNGNTIADKGDIFSLAHPNFNSVDYMAYGSGLVFTERDDNGYPSLSLNNERTVELLEKLLMIYNDTYEVFNAGGSVECFELFGAGETMFYVERFLALEKEVIRSSDVEYGIIPVPKLDDTIEDYVTPVGPLTDWGAVPITVSDPEMVSAVLELMAYEGYLNVIPAYYEVALKLKYTRGDDLDTASMMLDLITENQRTDFLSVNALGGMEQIFRKVVKSKGNTFASTYASLEQAANAKLAEYIKSYEGQ